MEKALLSCDVTTEFEVLCEMIHMKHTRLEVNSLRCLQLPRTSNLELTQELVEIKKKNHKRQLMELTCIHYINNNVFSLK